MPHTPSSDMPTIPFGPYAVSRLILGANPLNGVSHLSHLLDRQMKSYFTPQRVLDLLWHCQELGINTWQSNRGNLDLYREFRAQGGQMHYISLGRDDPADPEQIERLASAGTIGIAHFGELTDVLWREGQIDKVRTYCAKVRQSGVMVGVGTHIPDVIDHIVSQGWDVDFFMCCVYERHRTRDALKALLGDVPIPLGEVYLEGDTARTFKVMRQTDKPCLAFKILAAGRLCANQEQVEQAFRTTLQQIKPNDAVIVGMYPEYEDQAAINAKYVRQYSALSHSTQQGGM